MLRLTAEAGAQLFQLVHQLPINVERVQQLVKQLPVALEAAKVLVKKLPVPLERAQLLANQLPVFYLSIATVNICYLFMYLFINIFVFLRLVPVVPYLLHNRYFNQDLWKFKFYSMKQIFLEEQVDSDIAMHYGDCLLIYSILIVHITFILLCLSTSHLFYSDCPHHIYSILIVHITFILLCLSTSHLFYSDCPHHIYSTVYMLPTSHLFYRVHAQHLVYQVCAHKL